jgi:hypothetical protein
VRWPPNKIRMIRVAREVFGPDLLNAKRYVDRLVDGSQERSFRFRITQAGKPIRPAKQLEFWTWPRRGVWRLRKR